MAESYKTLCDATWKVVHFGCFLLFTINTLVVRFLFCLFTLEWWFQKKKYKLITPIIKCWSIDGLFCWITSFNLNYWFSQLRPGNACFRWQTLNQKPNSELAELKKATPNCSLFSYWFCLAFFSLANNEYTGLCCGFYYNKKMLRWSLILVNIASFIVDTRWHPPTWRYWEATEGDCYGMCFDMWKGEAFVRAVAKLVIYTIWWSLIYYSNGYGQWLEWLITRHHAIYVFNLSIIDLNVSTRLSWSCVYFSWLR